MLRNLFKPRIFFRGWGFKFDAVTLIQSVFAILLQLGIAVLVIGLIWNASWLNAFIGFVVLILTFFPAILERQLRVYLPVEWTLLTCIFLYASFVLGELTGFYTRFWWWDLMLHSLSSLMIGIIGFLMIYVFYMTRRVQIPPIYVASMTFSLAITTGTIWEIFEFSMDWFFGFNMQKSGLVDTMTDLIVDAVGGFIAAVLGYFYVKDGDSLLVDRLIKHFLARNPRIFARERRKKRSDQLLQIGRTGDKK